MITRWSNLDNFSPSLSLLENTAVDQYEATRGDDGSE